MAFWDNRCTAHRGIFDFGQLFDLSLESNAGEDVHVWDLAKIGNGLNLQSLTLGTIEAQNREESLELELQYKVTSLDGLLSSGTMMVEYMPIPDDFELSDAYPNPFNPSTSITLDVSDAGNVNVSVYNLMGQMVSTLTEGYMNAGTYTLNWNASDQVSGMYLVRAETAGVVSTQKLLLIK